MHDNQSAAVRFWPQVMGVYRMMLPPGRVFVFFKEYLVFSVLSFLALYVVDMVFFNGAYMQGWANFSTLSEEDENIFLHRFWPFLSASGVLWLLGGGVWGIIGMVRCHRWYLLQEEDRQWRWWFRRVDWMYCKKSFILTFRIALIGFLFAMIGFLFALIGLWLLIPLLELGKSDVVLGVSPSDIIALIACGILLGTVVLYIIRYSISYVAPALGEQISLKESIQRTKGRRWRCLGLLIVIIVIYTVVYEGLSFIVPLYPIQYLIGVFFDAFYLFSWALVFSFLYQALPRSSENAEDIQA